VKRSRGIAALSCHGGDPINDYCIEPFIIIQITEWRRGGWMKAEDIKNVALLGAGMIGNGLALHFAQAGYQVSLYSRTQQTIDKAIESTKSNLSMLLQKPADSDEIKKIVGRITTPIG
jgi:pyruvate/2-oxoglutarate dehydrogenase complex dihydrolipoamide dehydrogenase (E3) component